MTWMMRGGYAACTDDGMAWMPTVPSAAAAMAIHG
jgi:hypothetical protein